MNYYQNMQNNYSNGEDHSQSASQSVTSNAGGSFNTIAPEKINLLTDIIRQSQNVSSQNMVQFLLNSAATANAKGISFSDSETELIINALKTNMSPDQISQMDNIIRISKMMRRNS